ncbi:MAG: restriction endonuclease subunit S [Prevotella sp.]|nr:restriction endonuclease subunit S [Prevotella sp.]
MHSRLQGTTQNVGGKSMREGWEYKKLGEIIRPAKVVKNGEKKDLPILSITMHDGIVLQTSRFKKTIASVDTSTYKVVKNGQLVIAFPIDEGLIYTQNIVEAGIMSPAYNIWDVDFTNINRQFLTIYLHCPYAMNYYKSKLRGTTMRRRSIPREDLLNMPLPVPSLSTQESIVSELDKINELISLKKEQLKDYDNLAQSIFYDMFGDHTNRSKLKDIVDFQSGLVNPLEEPYCNMIHVGPANIESNTGKLIDLKTAKEERLISGKYLFDSSMILYSKIRPNLNKVTIADFKGICSADMYALIPKECIDKHYLLFLLKQKDFLDYAILNSGRANIPKINRIALLNYEAILPPLPLQQAFAKKIEAIEQQKQLISSEIKDLETLLASRMQYWFD